jgi:hypothetical protein
MIIKKKKYNSYKFRNANITFNSYFLFFIFVTKLLDNRGLNISPIIILIRPLIIVFILINKIGRTRLTRSKNIRSDSEYRLNLVP